MRHVELNKSVTLLDSTFAITLWTTFHIITGNSKNCIFAGAMFLRAPIIAFLLLIKTASYIFRVSFTAKFTNRNWLQYFHIVSTAGVGKRLLSEKSVLELLSEIAFVLTK